MSVLFLNDRLEDQVPEKLRVENLFTESAREVIDRVNRSAYVATIREGR